MASYLARRTGYMLLILTISSVVIFYALRTAPGGPSGGGVLNPLSSQEIRQAYAKRMGLDVKTMASGGGCDANVFNRKGIECANLGTGMRAIHTVKEWLDVKDMYAAAEMTLEIMKLNGELATK